MTLQEKVSYLKGLADGLELGDGKHDKLIKAIIDVLDDMAATVDDMDANMGELCEQVDEIDEDLSELEDEVYDDDFDDYDDEMDDMMDDDDIEAFSDDDEFFEVECPGCKESICISADMLESEEMINCPNCKVELEFDFTDEDACGEECDCHHDHE